MIFASDTKDEVTDLRARIAKLESTGGFTVTDHFIVNQLIDRIKEVKERLNKIEALEQKPVTSDFVQSLNAENIKLRLRVEELERQRAFNDKRLSFFEELERQRAFNDKRVSFGDSVDLRVSRDYWRSQYFSLRTRIASAYDGGPSVVSADGTLNT